MSRIRMMVKAAKKLSISIYVSLLLITVPFLFYPYKYVSGLDEVIDGVQVVTFGTREGEVNLYIPDDMSAGDTISAAIITIPNGATYEAQLSNLSILNKYVIQVNGQNFYVGDQSFTFKVPANMYGSSVKFTLRDEVSKEYSSSSIPVKIRPYNVIRPDVPGPIDYKSPVVGQTGRPVEIEGPFDGDFDTTDLKIGGKKAEKLAESPRKLVFETPPEVEGSTELELRESNLVVKRPFTNLRVLKIGEDGAVPVNRTARRKDLVEQPESNEVSGVLDSNSTDIDEAAPMQRLVFSSIEVESSDPSVDLHTPLNSKASILSTQLNARLDGSPQLVTTVEPEETMIASVSEKEIDTTLSENDDSKAVESELVETNLLQLSSEPAEAVAAIEIEAEGTIETDERPRPDILKSSGEKHYILQTQLYAKFMDTSLPEQPLVSQEKVQVTLINVEDAKGSYTIQVAAFRKEIDAGALSQKLIKRGHEAYVIEAEIPGKGTWYRVRIGKYDTKSEAASYGYKLKVREPMVKEIFVALID